MFFEEKLLRYAIEGIVCCTSVVPDTKPMSELDCLRATCVSTNEV